MTRHEELLERMRSANPVPHPDQTDRDELRVVFSLLTERRAVMTTAPKKQLDRGHRRLEPPRSPRRRRAAAFAASAAMLLAVVGVTTLLLQGDDKEPTPPAATTIPAPEMTAPSVTAPSETAPSPTAPPATDPPATTLATGASPTPVTDLVWSRIPHDPAVFGDGTSSVSANDIAFGQGLWIAVGRTAAVLGPDNAFVDRGTVLISSDGVRWERVAGHDELDLGESPWFDGGPTMNAVAATDDGFVVVGSRFGAIGAAGARGAEAAVWTSPDGRSWSAVPYDGDVFGGRTDPADSPSDSAAMRDIVAVGNTVIAVGEYANAAAVWRSEDAGATWTRLPHSDAVYGARDLPGPGGNQDFEAMSAITVGPDGFIAVGLDVDVAGQEIDRDAAVWRSPNGTEWQRLPDDKATFGGPSAPAMRDIVATPDGYVAVGFEARLDAERPGERAAAWFSPDGIVWQRIAHDGDVFGSYEDHLTMTGVAAGPGGLIAVGSRAGGASVVWTSLDGLTWTMGPADPAFEGGGDASMQAVVAAADGFIVVGSESGTSGAYAAIWIGASR